MNLSSYNEDVIFNDNKIATKLILESSFSKEMRILLKRGQVMKEHKTKYPIVVHILQGEIDFGVLGEVKNLNEGAIIALEGNVPHDLTALQDSVVRLTLSKHDEAERVEKVATDS